MASSYGSKWWREWRQMEGYRHLGTNAIRMVLDRGVKMCWSRAKVALKPQKEQRPEARQNTTYNLIEILIRHCASSCACCGGGCGRRPGWRRYWLSSIRVGCTSSLGRYLSCHREKRVDAAVVKKEIRKSAMPLKISSLKVPVSYQSIGQPR